MKPNRGRNHVEDRLIGRIDYQRARKQRRLDYLIQREIERERRREKNAKTI